MDSVAYTQYEEIKEKLNELLKMSASQVGMFDELENKVIWNGIVSDIISLRRKVIFAPTNE